MKKVLITGSSGMLGSNLAQRFAGRYDIYGVYRSRPNPDLRKQEMVDITDRQAVAGAVAAIDPDFVVHCAAVTNIDMCEADYKLARDVNAIGTKNLVSSVKSQARFIHVSTDSVFDGKKGNYCEKDTPSPLNNYAKTKLEGEGYVREASANYVIIRTNIFGWNMVSGRSFAEWVFENLAGGKPINMFTDVIFSPVTAGTLTIFIEKLLRMDYVGVMNVGSADSISKFEFGMKLANFCGFDKNLISPSSIDDFKFSAKRPKNTSLDTALAKGIFGRMPAEEEEILKFCEERGRHETLRENR